MRALLLVAALCPPTETPPARFDHPYPGRLVEYALPLEDVPAACANLTGRLSREVSGCGFQIHVTHDGTRTGRPIEAYGLIVYPEGCLEIRRHEIGHANGWAH
jgi:hypothetical protein